MYDRTTVFRAIGCTVVLGAVASPLRAEFPDRPLRWIVPAAAGGGADSSVRIIAPELALRLGQQIVIDNRPGASGTIGIGLVARAPADGYTLGSGNITNLAMIRATMKGIAYDATRDFQAVVQTHFQPNVLAVSPGIAARSVGELVELARRSPDALLYASSGNGSSLHFAGELFRLTSGAPIRHVPYNSIPVALNDVIGGRIAMIFDNLSSSAPHIKGGRLRGLAVTSMERSPVLPDLPTLAASGVPGYSLVVWGGIVAPAGTPRRVVERLNAAANAVLETPRVRERLVEGLGLQLVGGGAGPFAALIRNEIAKWRDVAAKAGIVPQS
jgi:tripartite-type tricarboxylate transporter receptor subunit TctC